MKLIEGCSAAALAGALFCSAVSHARERAPEQAAQTSGDGAPNAAALSCCTLAAGVELDIEIVDQVSSGTHRRGQTFAIRLTEAALVDGRTVLPAGTRGVGEVIHSARGSFGGKPGELILAARYLEHEGVRIPVRGLRYGGRGRDNSDLAFAAGIAAGPIAFLISGGEKRVPAGTIANVRVSADVTLAPSE